MKLNKNSVKILAMAAAIGLSIGVKAQGQFDIYALQKEVQLVALTNIAVATGFTTNTNTIDLEGKFIGSGYVNIWANTNYGTNTLTVTPQTSVDLTNWVSLSNYAISVSSPTLYTNINYSGSTNGALLSTNQEINPFTLTTPTASSAGWATQYPLPAPFTNSGALTPSFNVENRIGIQSVSDLSRYFRLLTVSSGTNIFCASFGGRRR